VTRAFSCHILCRVAADGTAGNRQSPVQDHYG
jgi:hypothetical protein